MAIQNIKRFCRNYSRIVGFKEGDKVKLRRPPNTQFNKTEIRNLFLDHYSPEEALEWYPFDEVDHAESHMHKDDLGRVFTIHSINDQGMYMVLQRVKTPTRRTYRSNPAVISVVLEKVDG